MITPMAQRWFVVTFCRIITGWEGMSKGEIIIYQTADGSTSLDIKLEQETIWLNQKQIAELFGTKRPAITKYLKNIFLSGELEENRVCSILEHTTPHGAMADKMQTTEVKYYNLDVILSVGYRVNSKNATRFRIWANKVLKEYLIKGYAVKENIKLEQYEDLKQTIKVLANVLDHKTLEYSETTGLLRVVTDYAYAPTVRYHRLTNDTHQRKAAHIAKSV